MKPPASAERALLLNEAEADVSPRQRGAQQVQQGSPVVMRKADAAQLSSRTLNLERQNELLRTALWREREERFADKKRFDAHMELAQQRADEAVARALNFTRQVGEVVGVSKASQLALAPAPAHMGVSRSRSVPRVGVLRSALTSSNPSTFPQEMRRQDVAVVASRQPRPRTRVVPPPPPTRKGVGLGQGLPLYASTSNADADLDLNFFASSESGPGAWSSHVYPYPYPSRHEVLSAPALQYSFARPTLSSLAKSTSP